MRALYIADNGFSFHSGCYYTTRPNIENLAQYGKYFDSISVIARDGKYEENSTALPASQNVWLIKKNDFSALHRCIRQHRNAFDIAIMRNGINGCFAAMSCKRLGIPYIGYCGADPYEFQIAKGTMTGRAEAITWRALERYKMRNADYAHYCTEYLHRNYPTKRPYLICSNVDISLDEKDLADRREAIVTPHEEFLVGMLGRLDENKGIRTILRALNELDGRYSVEVVGGGDPLPFLAETEALGLKDRVRFPGYCADQKALKQWLKKVDVYVQPSLSEGLPRSLIEAMAMGCPSVASNIAGIPELLPPEYLIEVNDHKMLAEMIRSLTERPEVALAAAEENFNKVRGFGRSVRDAKMDAFFGRIVRG